MKTKYCLECGARTFGEGWEDGICEDCYIKREEMQEA